MANLFTKDTYNENIGLDIDNNTFDYNGTVYGDYDLVKGPIISGSSDNYIIPANKNLGIPTLQNDNNYGLESLYDSRQGLNEPIIDEMLTNVNNGRVRDIFDVSSKALPTKLDNTMIHDDRETSVKGLLEETELSNIFFSDENKDALQMSIRYGVNQRTTKTISNQSEKELYIIMRSIMLQYANFKNGTSEVVEEVKRLNAKVLTYCIDNVSSNVLQYIKYLDDINSLPIPIERPEYLNKDNYTYDISNII